MTEFFSVASPMRPAPWHRGVRRLLLQALGPLLLSALALPGAAQSTYPNKPIKVIIPLAAGSAVDNAARVLTQKMSESLGQGFVIENIAGSAGLIGAERVARAAPDGYTLGGYNDSILTMVPHLVARMPWNALTDFEPVSLVGTIEWGLVVKADGPYKTLQDFLQAAKNAPGQLNYGSGGNGSPQHIGMALVASRAGLDLIHVPYKGATPAAVAGDLVKVARPVLSDAVRKKVRSMVGRR